MAITFVRGCALALALAACRTPAPGPATHAPATDLAAAPTSATSSAATTSAVDPWQACQTDADCEVVLVDRGACDLCVDTFGVASGHAADAIARYTPTELVDVCTDRHNTCAEPAAICVAGACGLGFEDWRGPTYGRERVVHPLPPR